MQLVRNPLFGGHRGGSGIGQRKCVWGVRCRSMDKRSWWVVGLRGVSGSLSMWFGRVGWGGGSGDFPFLAEDIISAPPFRP
jgi:hypothetical protein